MPTFTTEDGTDPYYKDWGQATCPLLGVGAIVFNHAYCLNADVFEDQMFFRACRGYRCLAAIDEDMAAPANRGRAMTSTPTPTRGGAVEG
jgi:pimeloyl-ACP methyl ester carboxylesterase